MASHVSIRSSHSMSVGGRAGGCRCRWGTRGGLAHVNIIGSVIFAGMSGTAIADVLFGDYNPGGKLPVTFYKSVDQLPSFEDYAMKGRTYRYFEGTPLYPFGFGLSYTSFSYSNLQVPKSVETGKNIIVSVDVTNTGKLAGDEKDIFRQTATFALYAGYGVAVMKYSTDKEESGKYGSALSFNGSGNIVNIPDSASLDLKKRYSNLISESALLGADVKELEQVRADKDREPQPVLAVKQRACLDTQGERDQEELPAGEAVHGPDLVGQVVIDHLQLEVRAGHAHQLVAPGQLAQVDVGGPQQRVEGQPLRVHAEALAVGGADHPRQLPPALRLRPPALQLGAQLGVTDVFQPDKGAVGRGFHTTTVLDPLKTNPACAPGETLVACELRLTNPGVVVIRLGANDVGMPDTFARLLRQMVELAMSKGVIPLLGTKADRQDPGNIINNSINTLASSGAYHIHSGATLRLTVVQGGCVETDDVVLAVRSLPACSISGTATMCPRSATTFTDSTSSMKRTTP